MFLISCWCRLKSRVSGATTLWWAAQTAATSSSGTDTLQSTSCSSRLTTTWSTACSRTPTTPVSHPHPAQLWATDPVCSDDDDDNDGDGDVVDHVNAAFLWVCFSSGFFRDRLWHQNLVTTGTVAVFQQSPRWWGMTTWLKPVSSRNPERIRTHTHTHRKLN